MNKRDELLRNAAKIIYKEGIQKLTMAYLAKKSDITKGGVLYHFENKANLLLQMNKMAIRQYEEKIEKYISELSGSYVFTRAYAFSTLDFLRDEENLLLPAVFITAFEDAESQALWEETTGKWDQLFSHDKGDPDKILELRLICDGIWFSVMYNYSRSLKDRMEQLVLQYCHSMEKGEC